MAIIDSDGIRSVAKIELPILGRRIAQIVMFEQMLPQGPAAAYIPNDYSIPQITEGIEFMSQVFTPKHVASELRVEVVFFGTVNAANVNLAVFLFQNGINDALGGGYSTNTSADFGHCVKFSKKVAAGSLAARTFSVRAGSSTNGNSVSMNKANGGNQYGNMVSGITITEYLPEGV